MRDKYLDQKRSLVNDLSLPFPSCCMLLGHAVEDHTVAMFPMPMRSARLRHNPAK